MKQGNNVDHRNLNTISQDGVFLAFLFEVLRGTLGPLRVKVMIMAKMLTLCELLNIAFSFQHNVFSCTNAFRGLINICSSNVCFCKRVPRSIYRSLKKFIMWPAIFFNPTLIVSLLKHNHSEEISCQKAYANDILHIFHLRLKKSV